MRKDLPVVADDEQIGVPYSEPFVGFRRVDAFRFEDLDAVFACNFAHWVARRGLPRPAMNGAIGPRHQSQHAMRRIDERLERRHRERSGSHDDERQGAMATRHVTHAHREW